MVYFVDSKILLIVINICLFSNRESNVWQYIAIYFNNKKFEKIQIYFN